MKDLAIWACLNAFITVSAASAGSPADPVVDPLVVAEETKGSSSGLAIVTLMAVLMLGTASN